MHEARLYLSAHQMDGGHLKYIKGMTLFPLYREILQEYLATMEQLNNKIKAFDVRIEELSKTERYKYNVGKLACFAGITRSRALAIVAEIGDFRRFAKPMNFAAYLCLVPGEKTSGKKHIVTVTEVARELSCFILRHDERFD